MTSNRSGNGPAIASYIAGAGERQLPPEIADMARLCLADWLGVAIGAGEEAAGRIVREVAAGWGSTGRATVLFANGPRGNAAAPFAALANGTLAHCLDFDDTYVRAITHTSAPVWAATLALGEEAGASEQALLAAFVTGFEVASRVGAGLGEAVTARGWHGTGVFGRLGAAAAAAALLELDAGRSLHALGAAATQTGGLTASFGTMAKPFHAGRAAMDGVVAAQLAAAGFEAATGLFEPGGGLDNALVQDRGAAIPEIDFAGWNITGNSFKPYAACHLTHPAIDAARALRAEGADPARALRGEGADPAAVRAVRAEIGALADQITGRKSGAPATPLEGKFDLKYCIALALHGGEVSAADFREPWRPDPAVCATAGKVAAVVSPEMGFASARLTLDFDDGRSASRTVPVAKGHPGNPMNWEDMRAKFAALAEPLLGPRTEALFGLARDFGRGGTLAEMRGILGSL
jgi:2-methylcitrate dehydratase PrpD